jgi:hypothetical protein
LGLWAFLRSLRLSERRILITVLAVAACGAVYFNTVYAWPKMIGGALILASAVFLRRRPIEVKGAIIAGLAASLSILAHGASSFGVAGLTPLFLHKSNRRRLLLLLAFGLIFGLTYLPWAAYQKFFDPPGDRLIKWHLAGAIQIDDRGAVQAIFEQYRSAGVAGVLYNKLNNVSAIVGSTVYRQNPGWNDSGPFAFLRMLQASSLVLAAGILLCGIAALPFNRRLRREAWVGTTFTILSATTLATVLIEFGNPVLASSFLIVCPFSLLLLWCAAGAVAITGFTSTVRNVFFGLHFLSFAVVWVFSFGPRSAKGEPADYTPEIGLMLVAAICVIALAALVHRMSNREHTAWDPSFLSASQRQNNQLHSSGRCWTARKNCDE